MYLWFIINLITILVSYIVVSNQTRDPIHYPILSDPNRELVDSMPMTVAAGWLAGLSMRSRFSTEPTIYTSESHHPPPIIVIRRYFLFDLSRLGEISPRFNLISSRFILISLRSAKISSRSDHISPNSAVFG